MDANNQYYGKKVTLIIQRGAKTLKRDGKYGFFDIEKLRACIATKFGAEFGSGNPAHWRQTWYLAKDYAKKGRVPLDIPDILRVVDGDHDSDPDRAPSPVRALTGPTPFGDAPRVKASDSVVLDNHGGSGEASVSVQGTETVPGASDADAPEADAPEADAPEADAAEADAPEADAPEADAPEADAAEADAAEADAPEADAPEADAPEADAAEADAPEADAPEADAAEADAPEADAPEPEEPPATHEIIPIDPEALKREETEAAVKMAEFGVQIALDEVQESSVASNIRKHTRYGRSVAESSDIAAVLKYRVRESADIQFRGKDYCFMQPYSHEYIATAGHTIDGEYRDTVTFHVPQYGYPQVTIRHLYCDTDGIKAFCYAKSVFNVNAFVGAEIELRTLSDAEWRAEMHLPPREPPVQDASKPPVADDEEPDDIMVMRCVLDRSKIRHYQKRDMLESFQQFPTARWIYQSVDDVEDVFVPSNGQIELLVCIPDHTQEPLEFATKLRQAGAEKREAYGRLYPTGQPCLFKHPDSILLPDSTNFTKPDPALVFFNDTVEQSTRLSYAEGYEFLLAEGLSQTGSRIPRRSVLVEVKKYENPCEPQAFLACIPMSPIPELIPSNGEKFKVLLKGIRFSSPPLPTTTYTTTDLKKRLVAAILHSIDYGRQLYLHDKVRWWAEIRATLARFLKSARTDEDTVQREAALDSMTRRIFPPKVAPVNVDQLPKGTPWPYKDTQSHAQTVEIYVGDLLTKSPRIFRMPDTSDEAEFCPQLIATRTATPLSDYLPDYLVAMIHAPARPGWKREYGPLQYVRIDAPTITMVDTSIDETTQRIKTASDAMKVELYITKLYHEQTTKTSFEGIHGCSEQASGVPTKAPEAFCKWTANFDPRYAVRHDLVALFPAFKHFLERTEGKPYAECVCSDQPPPPPGDEAQQAQILESTSLTYDRGRISEELSDRWLSEWNRRDEEQKRALIEEMDSSVHGIRMYIGGPGTGKSELCILATSILTALPTNISVHSEFTAGVRTQLQTPGRVEFETSVVSDIGTKRTLRLPRATYPRRVRHGEPRPGDRPEPEQAQDIVEGDDPEQQQEGDDPEQQQEGDDPEQQQEGDDPEQQQEGDDPEQQQQDGEPEQQQENPDPVNDAPGAFHDAPGWVDKPEQQQDDEPEQQQQDDEPEQQQDDEPEQQQDDESEQQDDDESEQQQDDESEQQDDYGFKQLFDDEPEQQEDEPEQHDDYGFEQLFEEPEQQDEAGPELQLDDGAEEQQPDGEDFRIVCRMENAPRSSIYHRNPVLYCGVNNQQCEDAARRFQEFNPNAKVYRLTDENTMLSEHTSLPKPVFGLDESALDPMFEAQYELAKIFYDSQHVLQQKAKALMSPFSMGVAVREYVQGDNPESRGIRAAERAKKLNRASYMQNHAKRYRATLQAIMMKLVGEADFIACTPVAVAALAKMKTFAPTILWMDEVFLLTEGLHLAVQNAFPDVLSRYMTGDMGQGGPLAFSRSQHLSRTDETWFLNQFGSQLQMSLAKRIQIALAIESFELHRDYRSYGGAMHCHNTVFNRVKHIEHHNGHKKAEITRVREWYRSLGITGYCGGTIMIVVEGRNDEQSGKSWFNRRNAEVVRELVKSFFAANLCETDPTSDTPGQRLSLGIITPYEQQNVMHKKALYRLSPAEYVPELVEVRTKHNAQGHQFGIAISDLTRTREPGFTSDMDIGSVLLSRGRFGNVIICSPKAWKEHFNGARHFGYLKDMELYCTERGASVKIFERRELAECLKCRSVHDQFAPCPALRCPHCKGGHHVRDCKALPPPPPMSVTVPAGTAFGPMIPFLGQPLDKYTVKPLSRTLQSMRGIKDTLPDPSGMEAVYDRRARHNEEHIAASAAVIEAERVARREAKKAKTKYAPPPDAEWQLEDQEGDQNSGEASTSQQPIAKSRAKFSLAGATGDSYLVVMLQLAQYILNQPPPKRSSAVRYPVDDWVLIVICQGVLDEQRVERNNTSSKTVRAWKLVNYELQTGTETSWRVVTRGKKAPRNVLFHQQYGHGHDLIVKINTIIAELINMTSPKGKAPDLTVAKVQELIGSNTNLDLIPEDENPSFTDNFGTHAPEKTNPEARKMFEYDGDGQLQITYLSDAEEDDDVDEINPDEQPVQEVQAEDWNAKEVNGWETGDGGGGW
ncbi:hypothetical protein F4780DRAFT_785441 [Xylariomycetidae sp. FL0641]|nr:hypothetical protein F4780DRAFT_785441 [Xylariomycetidae sp. FL0641]